MTNLERKKLAPTPSAVDLEGLLAYYQKQMREEAYFYLEKRGIAEETIELFRIGFELGKIGFYVDQNQLGDYFENRVIIPIRNYEGAIVDLIGRSIDHREPKYKALYGIDEYLFNYEVLADADDVVLCNGIFDVLSLVQARMPAVCVPDSLVFKEHHAKMLEGKRVFICMGNDELGRRESIRIESTLQDYAKETYIVHLPESIRDINDMFVRVQNPADAFVQLIHHTIEETMLAPVAPDARNITVYMEEYMKRHRGQVTGISTGIRGLDEALFGGFGSGLYLFAGVGSSGKSMLLKQIADHVAFQQTPVVFVSWDMTNYELWARSIARILRMAPRSVISGKVEPDRINEANRIYAQISKMLWTLECSLDTTLDQVAASIERIATIVGKEPVVFIDHLQRIPTGKLGLQSSSTWHQHQAAVAYTLKQWSRQWNSPIIAATALEHSQDRLPEGVEASADAILLLKQQGAEHNSIQPMSLDLLKNRNGSLSSIPLQFYNDQALFTE